MCLANRYFVLELCVASLARVFLPADHPEKYKGPNLPYHFEVLFQLASGLDYIHSIPLVHRDIKPENILISVATTTTGEEKVTMKWADFGLSRPVNERGTYAISKLGGTMDWLAPELLAELDKERRRSGGNKQQNDGGDAETRIRGTVRSDIFAAGCTFAYLFANGTHPYATDDADIATNIRRNRLITSK